MASHRVIGQANLLLGAVLGWLVVASCTSTTSTGAPPASTTFVRIGNSKNAAGWHIHCKLVRIAAFDPIAAAGSPPPVGHVHVFAGNETIAPDSSVHTLLLGPTNCTDRADHASYWAPALYS